MTIELTVSVNLDNTITAKILGEDNPLTRSTPVDVLPRIEVDKDGKEFNPFIDNPFELGTKLFDALGGDLLLERLEADPDYTLHLNIDQKATAIPWEFAATRDKEFLVCTHSVLRVLPDAQPTDLIIGDRLNFVVLTADPLVDEKGMPYSRYKLDIENELQAISTKLNQSNCAIHAQRVPPTSGHFQKALEDAAPTILHLSCHFNIKENPSSRVAVLQLEDSHGQVENIQSEKLVQISPPGTLQLVLISASHGTSSILDAELARLLVQAGVPAAVGMQGSFPEPLADELAAMFYDFLLCGYDIGESMRQMRQVLLVKPYAIGLPVAYVGPQGGPSLKVVDGTPQVTSMTQEYSISMPTSLRPPQALLGRERELHQLAKTFDKHNVVTVVGTGGIGKTALASSFVQRFGWRFQKNSHLPSAIGVSLADMPVLNAENVLHSLLTQLSSIWAKQAGELNAEQMRSHLLEMTESENTLIFVDNYEAVLQGLDDTGDEMANGLSASTNLHDTVRYLAKNKANLLLTSRRHPAGLRGEVIFPTDSPALDGVEARQGAILFFIHSSRANEGNAKDQDLAISVSKVTAGHPLAIALLAGEYDHSLEVNSDDFIASWEEELATARRPELAAHHITFERAFSRSFDHLTQPQQQRLVALSRFGAPFFAEGAMFLWNRSLPDRLEMRIAAQQEARSELTHFVQRSLLRVDTTFTFTEQAATYRLDPVISHSLEARIPNGKLNNLETGYHKYASWLVNLAYGKTENDSGLKMLIQQWLDELIALAPTQPDRDRGKYCWQLSYMVVSQFNRPEDGENLLRIGQSAASLNNDESLLSKILYEQANLAMFWGNPEQALSLYEESLTIQKQIGDDKDRSATLHELANLHRIRGDLDQAFNLYNESLEIKDRLGDIQGRSATLHELANLYRIRGDLSQALSLYNESLDIQKKIGDIKGLSASLHLLANVYVIQGDLDRALSLYNESLDIKDKLDDIQGRSATLHELAYVYSIRGDLDRALSLYDEAFKIDEINGDIQGRAATLSQMANIRMRQKEWIEAEQLLEKALQLSKKLGDISSVAYNLGKLGQVATANGSLSIARQRYADALQIFNRLGMPEAKQIRQMLARLDG
ncbi:MAG: tetratricopeptide repeat protein [Chloroflexota bacterium]